MERSDSVLWFIRLRLFAFCGQLAVLALAAGFFALTIPWVAILSCLFLIPVSSFGVMSKFARELPEKTLLGTFLVVDTFILTAVLALAGGPTNPFTITYILHVVLAAILLTPAWTWGIAALSTLGYGMLFVYSLPVPEWGTHGAHHGFSLHLHGMLFAYITVAALVAYFINRIARELRVKERQLERLENIASNQQRLASLTALTAGAAHELSTPLATIAIVTRELERTLAGFEVDQSILDDLTLLKGETLRCKELLAALSEKSGDLLGETPQNLTVSELLKDAIAPLRGSPVISGDALSLVLTNLPKRALTMAIRALIKNALEASTPESAAVQVRAESAGEQLNIFIQDFGVGISTEHAERIGEPFFSTKGAENGMGLGVYLSRLTVEQLDGELRFTSHPNNGTTVSVSFPLNGAVLRVAA